MPPVRLIIYVIGWILALAIPTLAGMFLGVPGLLIGLPIAGAVLGLALRYVLATPEGTDSRIAIYLPIVLAMLSLIGWLVVQVS